MFAECLASCGCVLNDAAVRIDGQIRACKRISGDNQIINEAEACVDGVASTPGMLKKSELLEIWKDATISFAARCLVTLWWGHPNYRVLNKVYSSTNLNKLSEHGSRILEELTSISSETDNEQCKLKIAAVYDKFLRGGDYRLDGISEAFFTKFFHFWFASHPLVSKPNYLPVIADKWMKMAVCAEMIDVEDLRRRDLFKVNFDCLTPIVFRRNTGQTYGSFLDFYNARCDNLRYTFPAVTPFILEDVLFNNHARRMSETKVRNEM